MDFYSLGIQFDAVKQAAATLEKTTRQSASVLETQDLEALQLHAEHCYKAVLRALADTQYLLQILHSPHFDYQALSNESPLPPPFHMEVGFVEDPCCFHAVFDTPPILKRSMAKANFAEAFLTPLAWKVIHAIPPGFKKFSSVYVVYINHADRTSLKKQPYFDNDNLALKGIMDAVVPYICVDDACVFCDDIYLYQQSTTTFAELYIIPKSSFPHWIRTHQHLDFCKNLSEKFT